MKRILLAFLVALSIHLSVLKMDLDWILVQDRVAPRAQMTTMRLVARLPVALPAIAPLPSSPMPLLPKPRPAPKKPPVRKTIAKPKPVPKKAQSLKPIRKNPSEPTPISPARPQPAVTQPDEPLSHPNPEPGPPTPQVAHQNHATRPASPPATLAHPPSNPEPLKRQSSSDVSTVVVMAKPRYSDNPPPVYPSIARKRKYQGTVVLEVFVKEDGQVGDLRIAATSNYSLLDRAAMKAVRGWQFEPARRGNHTLAMWVKVPIRFHLK